MNPIHLLLFDVDGTLLTSGGAGASALNAVFGRAWGVENAMRHVQPHGKTDEMIVQEMFRSHLGRSAEAAEVAALLREYVELLPARVAASKNFRLAPGVPGLLARLNRREDLRMGLGTGNIEQGARIKLERGELNRFFSFGGFGSDSADRKTLLEVGFDRGEEIVRAEFPRAPVCRWVIGDTWRDVAAGRACGAKTIAVATGGDSLYELAESRPDFLLATLEDEEGFCALLDAGGRG